MMGELGKQCRDVPWRVWELGNKISIAHDPIPYDTLSEAEVFPVPCSLT